MFADIAGFTPFAERVGEESAFEMLRTVTGLMQTAIEDQSGTVGEFRGDGILALFSVTSGLEDGPLRACRAGLQLQASIREFGAEMKYKFGEAPQVRVGIHCGPLVVGSMKDNRAAIVGDTANVASRLETMASAGEVLISKDLYALVEGQVEADDLGERPMKGKSQPQRVFRLRAVREDVSRFDASKSQGLSPLVDRDEELATMMSIFDRSKRGRVEITDIRGEPGIGKSRLVHEFEAWLQGKDVRVFRIDCRSDGASVSFMPFAELLRSALSISEHSTAADIETRIVNMLENLGMKTETTLPYLLALLGKRREDGSDDGMSPDMVGDRMRQVIVDIIARICKASPVVMLIEDLHWVDPGSEQIIDRLASLERQIPLMMVCTSRPQYDPVWRSFDHTTTIDPRLLSDTGVSALILERLPEKFRTAGAAPLIIRKAEGNPLYAEEIAKFLLLKGEGEVTDAGLNGDALLPMNLQNMVLERFDKLPEAGRNLLQAASVMGRKFDGPLANRITNGDYPFDESSLTEALNAELILRVGEMGTEFEFKHALVQDAIRETLLTAQKKALHAKIGDTMEDRYANQIEEVVDSLAYHFDHADSPLKAATYLIEAGLRNLKLFSLAVANDAFARAFELLESEQLDLSEEQIADLFAGWFEVQQWRAEFGRTIALFESQQKRLDAISANNQYARILGLVGVAYCQNLMFKQSKQCIDKAIAIGERNNDRDAMVHGYLGLMVLDCSAPQPGSIDRIEESADKLNALLGDDAQPYYRTYGSFYRAWRMSIRGDIDQAHQAGHKLIEIGEETNYTGAIGWGAICVAFNNAYSEEYETAIKFADIGAKAAGGQVDRLICLGLKGFSMVLNGDPEGGAKILQEILDKREELDYLGIDNIVYGPMGLAKFLGGDMSGGARWLQDAIDRAIENGNTHGAAMAHISLATVYLLLATSKEKPSFDLLRKNALFLLRTLPFAKSRAVAHFEQAIELGQRVGMLGVTAQALHGRAMALKAMGKKNEARSSLQEAQKAVGQIDWNMLDDRIEQDLKELS